MRLRLELKLKLDAQDTEYDSCCSGDGATQLQLLLQANALKGQAREGLAATRRPGEEKRKEESR